MLEYTKLVVSILLIGIFFILFGLERIQMLKDKGVVISRFEETPSQFPSPGHILSSSGSSLTSWLTPRQVYEKSREDPEIGLVMG